MAALAAFVSTSMAKPAEDCTSKALPARCRWRWPNGKRNGAFRHGLLAAEADQRALAELLLEARKVAAR